MILRSGRVEDTGVFHVFRQSLRKRDETLKPFVPTLRYTGEPRNYENGSRTFGEVLRRSRDSFGVSRFTDKRWLVVGERR